MEHGVSRLLPHQNYNEHILLDTTKSKLEVAGWGTEAEIPRQEAMLYKQRGFNTSCKIHEYANWTQTFVEKGQSADQRLLCH